MIKFFDHQKEIIKDDPFRAGLFLGTGSGKTLLACKLAQGNTLTVCTKTLVEKKTWEKEWIIAENTNHLTVISKDQIKLVKNKHIVTEKYNTIIIDEAHRCVGIQPATYQKDNIKYPKTSILYKTLYQLIVNNPQARIYLLTATPTTTPMSVYGLSQLLGYKWSFEVFRNTFYYEWKRNIFLKKKGEKLKEKLAKVVNNIGYVGKLDDWVDVPKQTYRQINVGMTSAQEKQLKELMLIYPDPHKIRIKGHMLEQGVYSLDEGIEYVKENKTEAIDNLMLEFGKVVVYCSYTKQLEYYDDILSSKGHKVFVLNGQTKNHGELLEKADSEDCILLIQSSISEGYEITSFKCMIFASEVSFKDRYQSEGRILRVNNLKKNIYITLIASIRDTKARACVENGEDYYNAVHKENNK